MWHGILNWILEEKEGISRKTGEIWIKSVVLKNASWLCKMLPLGEAG